MGFVALSRFVVASGHTDEVKQAFRDRPHMVEGVPGFRKLDVISPHDCPDEIWLITHWDTEVHFHTWHRSHHHKDAHKGIPKGLKLVPKSAQQRFFEYICS